jgi:hypothetical protein
LSPRGRWSGSVDVAVTITRTHKATVLMVPLYSTGDIASDRHHNTKNWFMVRPQDANGLVLWHELDNLLARSNESEIAPVTFASLE